MNIEVSHLPFDINSESANFSAGVLHHMLDRLDVKAPKEVVDMAPVALFAPRGEFSVDHLHLPSERRSPFTLDIPLWRSHLASNSKNS